MKKIIALLFVGSVLTLASCESKPKTEEALVDSAAVAVDSANATVDSAAVAVDSAATASMSAVAPADSAK